MKEIKLTKGNYAIVDDNLFEKINSHKWHSIANYAVRKYFIEGKYKTIRMHEEILGIKEGFVIDHIKDAFFYF